MIVKKRPVLLAILDGWGIGKKDNTDAIFLANTPNLDKYLNKYPCTCLIPHGRAVGLPSGIMGNSEVGHQNIGAGRVVYQALVKINIALEDKTFFSNPTLMAAFQNAKDKDTSIHFMGLLSDGGVHSTEKHLYGLMEMAKRYGLDKVYIHPFMDGRDTPPDSGKMYMQRLVEKISELGVGAIASVAGRYWAMDRDKNYDRVINAYEVLINGNGPTADNALSLLEERYANKEYDEFIKPTVILKDGSPTATIGNDDSVIFFNFRPDRARELAKTLINKIDDDPQDIFVNITPPRIHFVSMTQYQEGLTDNVAFAPEKLTNTMGEVVSEQGLNQLRIAETEKYAHVTFFFNGGEEKVFANEERILVPSPKEVQGLYNKKPEMSAYLVTEKLLDALNSDKYDFIVLNFANMDMVGHTGMMDAAIQAVEAVDICVGKIVDKVLSMKGALVITADHGNADIMIEDDGSPMTAHSMNPVPLVVIGVEGISALKQDGKLADISPTCLDILGIDKPLEMTGESLLVNG